MPIQLVIHGHFYQPPRENPWTGAIERQESASPFHDWNARVAHECYLPNARSRVLDERGRIQDIVNNYERLSWNFGPTLLAWISEAAPDLLKALVAADRASLSRLGHGNAIAGYELVVRPEHRPETVRGNRGDRSRGMEAFFASEHHGSIRRSGEGRFGARFDHPDHRQRCQGLFQKFHHPDVGSSVPAPQPTVQYEAPFPQHGQQGMVGAAPALLRVVAFLHPPPVPSGVQTPRSPGPDCNLLRASAPSPVARPRAARRTAPPSPA